MAYIIDLPTYKDERGTLTVIEKIIPFDIKRVYYIYNVHKERGGHRHQKTIQALICLNGKCEVFIDNGKDKITYLLNNPSKCLIVEPKDWHIMRNFSKGSILLVISSEYYDLSDYIKDKYQ